MEIKISLPPNLCSPNVRGHWGAVANAKKAYRLEAKYVAQNVTRQLGRTVFPASARISYVFHQKGLRKGFTDGRGGFRDRDNAIAAMKSAQDGLIDAGIVKNDAQFTIGDVVLLTAKQSEGRFVIITIEESGK